jgi:hypothetical protein
MWLRHWIKTDPFDFGFVKDDSGFVTEMTLGETRVPFPSQESCEIIELLYEIFIEKYQSMNYSKELEEMFKIAKLNPSIRVTGDRFYPHSSYKRTVQTIYPQSILELGKEFRSIYCYNYDCSFSVECTADGIYFCNEWIDP